MNCHKEGGDGEGLFTVAGTVYHADQTTPYPNAVVILSTVSSHSIAAAIEVDAKGNFYTTEVDWAGGLNASVADDMTASGSMISILTNGACNSCHDGTTVDRIYIE